MHVVGGCIIIGMVRQDLFSFPALFLNETSKLIKPNDDRFCGSILVCHRHSNTESEDVGISTPKVSDSQQKQWFVTRRYTLINNSFHINLYNSDWWVYFFTRLLKQCLFRLAQTGYKVLIKTYFAPINPMSDTFIYPFSMPRLFGIENLRVMKSADRTLKTLLTTTKIWKIWSPQKRARKVN